MVASELGLLREPFKCIFFSKWWGSFKSATCFWYHPILQHFFTSFETPFQAFFRRPCLVVFGPIRCKNTILALWVNFFWGEVVDLYKGRQGTTLAKKKCEVSFQSFPIALRFYLDPNNFRGAARLQLQLRGS